MSEASEEAFRAAQAEIARVKAAGELGLNLSILGRHGYKARFLTSIPQEIAELANLTDLLLGGTAISDLSLIKKMAGLRVLDLAGLPIDDLSSIADLTGITWLNLSGTRITDLTPIAGMIEMATLSLSDTHVSELAPIAGMTGMKTLNLTNTSVRDLRPIKGMTLLAEEPRLFGVTFDRTPAVRESPWLGEIAGIEDAKERGRALLDYLNGLNSPPPAPPIPPQLPDRLPSMLEVEITGGQLVRRLPSPALPDGPVRTRAEIGWDEIRLAREDFAQAVNLDNYRPIKAAIAALDRAMGAHFGALNQIAVGMAGDRLARLAADADLARALPEGAGSELGALAAAVQVLANRFPEWIAYQRDSETEDLVLLPEADQALGKIGQALLAAPEEVQKDVTEEFRDEVELARENPKLSQAVGAVLGSTHELLRVLAENVLGGVKAGWKAAADMARAEGRALRRIAPDEIRKWTLKGGAFGILGIALDVIFNQSVYLMTLAASYPQWFGWVPTLLRYLGAIP